MFAPKQIILLKIDFFFKKDNFKGIIIFAEPFFLSYMIKWLVIIFLKEGVLTFVVF